MKVAGDSQDRQYSNYKTQLLRSKMSPVHLNKNKKDSS